MKPFLINIKRTPVALAIICACSTSNMALAEIITDGDVTAGATSPIWTVSGSIVVGATTDGTLSINDGSTVSSAYGNIGQSAGSTGTTTISGENSAWNMSGMLTIGDSGTGILNITDGASLTHSLSYIGNNAGGSGTINVSGANSLLDNLGSLYLGYNGDSTGILNITDGGTVNVTNNNQLGVEIGSSGTILASGANSLLNSANSIAVGAAGDGLLTIEDGGQVNNTVIWLGLNATGTGSAVISGTNSQLNSQYVAVGYEGKGDLTLSDNAQVNTDVISIATNAGSIGTVNIGSQAGVAATAAGYLNAQSLQLGAGDATLVFNHTNTDYGFSPTIDGNGKVDIYSGTTIFNSANTYTGPTTLFGGVLKAGAENTLSAQSDYLVDVGAKIDLAGFNQTLASLNNSGTVDFAGTGNTTLNIAGNYVGNGGQINMSGVLADDASVTDKLLIGGDSTGTTFVTVKNLGGYGAQTLNGIELIKVNGTDSSGEFIQNDRIVSGAYDYSLVRGTDANSNNWYLTSAKPAEPDMSVQRPEAGSYAANLAAANNMFVTTLHDRLGETQYIDALTGEHKVTSMWLRNEGGHNRSRDTSGQLSTQANRYVLQLGGDIAQWSSNATDRFHLGVMAGYGNSKSTTVSQVSGYNAKGSTDGYSTGIYGTWYANEAEKSGLYVDSWAQYSWFNNTVDGQNLASEEYKSKGVTASVESGYTFKVGENAAKNATYFIQPKAQVTWMGVKADDHKEANGTNISGEGDGNIQTRLGVKAFMNGYAAQDKGKDRVFQPFVEANWIHNTKDFGSNMDNVTVKQDGAANIAELKMGVEGQLNKQVNLWGNVGQQIGNKGYSDTAVMLGVKYNF